MATIKRVLLMLLVLVTLLTTGCSSSGGSTQTDNSGSAPTKENDSSNQDVTPTATVVSTPENDSEVGLKNIKIDTTERELTDQQKAVITYFDNDYLEVPSYEFLRRYPTIFQDAQIEFYGMVVKVISMDSENYKIVIWLNVTPAYAPYSESGEYVILSGKTGASWFMENDVLFGDGRYTGVDTVEIDGVSYTIPTIDVYNAYYSDGRDQFYLAEKFDYTFIKTVAEAIFGNNIEIREPIPGEDMSEDTARMQAYALGGDAYAENLEDISPLMDLLVELEDQSNANFQKFRFSKYQGAIIDAKGPFDSGIERSIEFSADFEHFFLFTRNESLETLKLAYYTKDFTKIWEREFDEITSAVYDYTENNLYIAVNNELYIINIETGEDTFAPSYVGEKKEIRKFSDGIVTVSASKSDGIMKSALSGDILWKTNLPSDPEYVNGIQLVDGNLVLDYNDADWTQHYCLIDNATGEILVDAVN
jgi:hypothetical protein